MTIRETLLGVAYQRMLRPLLFASHSGDAEAVHEQTIRVLAGPGSAAPIRWLLRLLTGGGGEPVTVAGIRFPNRVGLAAGMDKDGLAVRAWQGLGFGFAEVGTVTARPQPGNDRPRLFRLRASEALVNRMGFNNAGAPALARTLSQAGVFRGNLGAGIPVGVSIGKTKIVPMEEAVPDYLACFDAVAPHADYVAVNVSSPNTPGLRELQGAGELRELASALTTRATRWSEGWRPWLGAESDGDGSSSHKGDGSPGHDGDGSNGSSAQLNGSQPTRPLEPSPCPTQPDQATGTVPMAAPTPIFVKIAPDLTWHQVDDILAVCEEAGIAGVIATNTTLARGGVAPADQAIAAEQGGLSGRPLTLRAREVVGYVTCHTTLPVIASGGVMTPADATRLQDLGASLIQLCTGFIYAGPCLPLAINEASHGDGDGDGSFGP